MTAIHQFHPTLAPGDAISNHVLALAARAREWGHESHAYAVDVKPGVATEVLPYRRLFRAVKPEDLLVLHFSMGHEVFDQLVKLEARKVLVYHNITPPRYFVGINPHASAHAQMGLRQLQAIAPRIDLAIGVSEFNRTDLERAGYRNTARVPILIDWKMYDVAPDPEVLRHWETRPTLLLFVGRISPHKRQDELIRLLGYYRRCIDPEAELVLVGNHRDQPQYYERLTALAAQLGLADAVTFTGSVSTAELVAFYQIGSCFISLSEHEGFAVPLLEAMRFGRPIVAVDAAAVGETLGGAGLLLPQRDVAEAAEASSLLLERADLREAYQTKATARLRDFDTEVIARQTREALAL
jgi:glycosyltransferase involved in cell wall biosynthesis